MACFYNVLRISLSPLHTACAFAKGFALCKALHSEPLRDAADRGALAPARERARRWQHQGGLTASEPPCAPIGAIFGCSKGAAGVLQAASVTAET